MRNKLIIIFIVLICQRGVFSSEPNDILEKLNQSVKNLKNLSADIEYIHSQPVFDMRTVRSGELFYVKDVNNSALRINFLTIQQDDAARRKQREEYVFDGFKVTRIDYQAKSAAAEQLSKDKRIEPLELVQSHFPIIGFSRPDELYQDFDIKVKPKEDKEKFITLILVPKADSRFSKIYKQVDIKIDAKSFLPFEFSGLTVEDERIEIKLSKMNTSTKIKGKVFDIVVPEDFVRSQK
ncbi:MAG: hypothetical protein JW806_01600 [Sedimentisphaerales bacterium]|nr:hypothetical protein [Sedimentisphaerales bacterium]